MTNPNPNPEPLSDAELARLVELHANCRMVTCNACPQVVWKALPALLSRLRLAEEGDRAQLAVLREALTGLLLECDKTIQWRADRVRTATDTSKFASTGLSGVLETKRVLLEALATTPEAALERVKREAYKSEAAIHHESGACMTCMAIQSEMIAEAVEPWREIGKELMSHTFWVRADDSFCAACARYRDRLRALLGTTSGAPTEEAGG